ncbi:BglG family transcription antiterminator [Lonepinella sp. MS14435]|uniref:BglG family transcription antiterminator n=1 Tax=Lonepinella sp. MS14435 TaxID=3003618 RepID=UPI0036DBA62E
MFNKKEIAILQYLFEHQDSFVTSNQLASHLNYSDRTIRSYIKNITIDLPKYGAELVAKQGLGYQLVIKNLSEFQLQLNLKKQNKRIESKQDRQKYILNKLFFSQPYLLFDDLEQELFVSRSTLSADFKEISDLIKPYHLTITSKANQGVSIVGHEQDYRAFIMDYFFKKDFGNAINRYIGNTIFIDEIRFENLLQIIIEECRKGKLYLADFILQNLALHILLAINRIKTGHKLNINIQPDELDDYFIERMVAENIIDRIRAENNIQFPRSEIDYIALHLLAKGKRLENKLSQIEQKTAEIKQIIIKIEQALHIQIVDDEVLINAISQHLQLLITRLKNNITVENPLCQEIMQNYQDIFQLVCKYFDEFSDFQGINVSNDEYSYLALHILAAIERYQNKKKLKVLVVCTTGYSSAQFIKNRLEYEFNDSLIIKDVVSYYELNDQILADIDFIVSSIDLSNLVFKVPVVHSSIFLKNDEFDQIRNMIKQIKSKDLVQTNKFIPIEEIEKLEIIQNKKLLLSNFFNENYFIRFNNSASKEEVIETLVQHCAYNETEKYPRRMLEQIKQRERLSSVVFSQYIAVPHPIKPVGEQSKVAVGIIPQTLVWDKLHQQIQLVFLISPSQYGNAELKQITSAIVKLTEDEYLQQQLIQCQDFNQFIQLFSLLI